MTPKDAVEMHINVWVRGLHPAGVYAPVLMDGVRCYEVLVLLQDKGLQHKKRCRHTRNSVKLLSKHSQHTGVTRDARCSKARQMRE